MAESPPPTTNTSSTLHPSPNLPHPFHPVGYVIFAKWPQKLWIAEKYQSAGVEVTETHLYGFMAYIECFAIQSRNTPLSGLVTQLGVSLDLF